MVKSFFELCENNWVQVMTPDATRNHCLAVVDIDFAKSHCGKIFNLRDLVGVAKDESKKLCQRCEKKIRDIQSDK